VIKDVPRKVKCIRWCALIWHRHWKIILSSLELSGTLLEKGHCIKLWKVSILPWWCQICWSSNHIHWYRPIRSPPLLYQGLSGAKRYHRCTFLVQPCKPMAWAYSISSIMQPFWSLVKRNTKFYWDETLDQLFQGRLKEKDSKLLALLFLLFSGGEICF